MLGLGVATAAVMLLVVAVEFVCVALGPPLPSSLIAMLVIFGVCVVRGAVPAALDRLCKRALPWLPLYFVPACALALVDIASLGSVAVAIVLVITAGTAAAAAVTAWVAHLSERRARDGARAEDAP